MNVQASNLLELLGGGGGQRSGEVTAKGDGPGKGRTRGAEHFFQQLAVVLFGGGFPLEKKNFYTTKELSRCNTQRVEG